MVAEAPLHLDGQIAWDEGIRWHFEEETHRLLAKELPGGEMLAVVTDPLGTPKEMFDARGRLVWAADHHVWGAVRAVEVRGALAMKPAHARAPDALACPWRFPGQYEDAETGLYYNRHRHYDPLTGHYASPDPIGLAGGDRPQAYVPNPTVWVDPLGLSASSKALAPSGPPFRLPAYDGKTTTGYLLTNEGKGYWLRSGDGLPQYRNYANNAHVEQKAAIIIRNTGSSGGRLWHNNPNTCKFCQTMTNTFLPENAGLDVIDGGGNISKFLGNATSPKLAPGYN
ncbi:RHS repeat domain-containing protein [Consotaella aegiceratis]|uniref:RHS repeat domain-containing protein n=1 Tax=Consotaella aegiceratis TaxID=3097961 RepID=UPI002F405379